MVMSRFRLTIWLIAVTFGAVVQGCGAHAAWAAPVPHLTQ